MVLLKMARTLALTSFVLQVPSTAVPPSPESPKSGKKAAPETRMASLTGCIDERDGRYVLTGDEALRVIADLEADGFPAEGFAKHLGQTVTVRGKRAAGDGRPLFRVRSITTVKDTCARVQPSK